MLSYLNTYFRSFLYSLINCEQFRTEKLARKAFFIRIVRICIVGQSDAIIGEGVLIRDYRLTQITFETPLIHPDVQTSIKNFRSQKIKNFRDRPFNGRFFLWAFHFIFFLRELNIALDFGKFSLVGKNPSYRWAYIIYNLPFYFL